MPILSESELEAVLSRMIIKLGKIIHYRGQDSKLEAARRRLQIALDRLLKGRGSKLEPDEAKGLVEAAEIIRSAGLGDQKLEDDSFDAEDYLSYRM